MTGEGDMKSLNVDVVDCVEEKSCADDDNGEVERGVAVTIKDVVINAELLLEEAVVD